MHASRTIVAASLLLAAIPPAASADGLIRYRIVSLQGQPAPGSFGHFAQFAGPFAAGEPRPAIDADGNHALFGSLGGPGLTGVWSEVAGGLSLLAQSGQAAPGTIASFLEFPSFEVPAAPIIAGGSSLFTATLSGPGVNLDNRFGLWSDRSGSLELVVRQGDPAPGLTGVMFSWPAAMAFNAQGHVLLSGVLAGAGTVYTNNESLWSDRTGALSLVVRESDPAPGTAPGVVFGPGQLGASTAVFPEARMNDQSRIAFVASLAGPGITSFNDEALYIETAHGLEILVREGDPAPGAGPGITFGGQTIRLSARLISYDDAGRILFMVRTGDANHTAETMCSNRGGTLAPIAQTGQPAPGTTGTFTLLHNPRMNRAGRIAFLGTTVSGFFPPAGIWWDQHGTLEPLLIPGMMPPSLEGSTINSVPTIEGYATSGLLAAQAGLHHPELGALSSLLLIEPAGTVYPVAIVGEQFDADGQGSFRTIDLISPGGLSETGELAFRLRFTDGSEGHYSARIEALCYANCDGSAAMPVLNVDDFTCFINEFAAAQALPPPQQTGHYANCDGSTTAPVLNVDDFTCFINAFAAGCE